LNDYFNNITLMGLHFQFNVSVIFFCLGFFIIDLITEIYDKHIADYFIYSKLISQALFILLGNFGTFAAGLEKGQLVDSFSVAPYVLINSMIASYVGYKLTSRLMQHFKIKFNGRFLFSRYLSSTLPGEVVFSLVFTILSFSHGKAVPQIINIFFTLVVVKIVLSFAFGFFVTPVTNLIRHFLEISEVNQNIKSLPFKSLESDTSFRENA